VITSLLRTLYEKSTSAVPQASTEKRMLRIAAQHPTL